MNIRERVEDIVSMFVAKFIVETAGCVPSDAEIEEANKLITPEITPQYNPKPQSHTLASSEFHNDQQMSLDEDPVRQNLYK